LVDFIENDLNLEKELEEFEKTFERDKVVELKILKNYFFKFPCILK
jgi:hypothetical protein